jgi:hypothetical protein
MTFNTFLILLLVLAAAYLLVKFILKRIIWWEVAVVIPMCFIAAYFASWTSVLIETHDTEVWNSQVILKKSVRVSCSHSYQCNCRTE